MPKVRVLVAALVAIGLVAVALPAGAQSDAEPKATEVGVTASEIHVAVPADVDNPFQPGLFQGVVDGANGAAKYLNSKAGGGGIGGRKIVVDFLDTKLNPNQSRNAVITACGQDFAVVSSAMLFLTSVDDEVNCKDAAGAAVGLPDMGAIVTGVAQWCSPVSYPVTPSPLDCATKDQTPQTFYGNAGPSKYLVKQSKKPLHGAFLIPSDSKDAQRGSTVLVDAAIAGGVKADQQKLMSGRDPQSAYTPIISQMKADGSNYAQSTLSANSSILLRSEAQLQGLDSGVVWTCGGSCYTKDVSSNSVMEGTHVYVGALPFEEASTNAMLRSFLKYVPSDQRNNFAVSGWSAMIAFAQAARVVVTKDGVNGLTRKALLDTGIPTLTKFDTGGMTGTINVAKRIGTPCFIMLQVKGGKFVREHPAKKGTFDCAPSNRVKLQQDLLGI
jgi:ABC-type branched-subunit amino acid transport system substrate-binding protein